MATTLDWDTLRALAAFRAERGCAISVFLGLDPSETATARDLQTRVNSILDEAAKSEAADHDRLSHEQREALKTDLDRVRRFFGQEFNREGTRGVAVFCAGLDNGWSTLDLADPVPDGVRVGRQYSLAPLVPLLAQGSGALVAHVSREQGQVYRLGAGRLEEVVDRSEEQPGRHDQGGWSQARYQRHIEHLVQGHLKNVAEELDRLVRQAGSPPIVILSTEELRSEFEGMLSKEARNRVVGGTNVQAHASPSEVLQAVEPVLEAVAERAEQTAIERWREEAGRNGRATSGWNDTFEAASDARVDLLLYQDGAQHPGWRCPVDGRVSARPGNCPLDGTEMEKDVAGLDLVVHQTLAHGGRVLAVRYHQDLQPVEGIGAVLRF
jgi:hypothetical protein